jgi:hypothetical protein
MIEFNCPDCNKKIKVKPEFAGRSGKCPNCSVKLVVPSPQKPASQPIQQSLRSRTLPVEKASNDISFSPAPITPAIQTQSSVPQTAVQVNIHNSQATNSLGISSLIIGILSVFVCWLPIFGFVLSGLGLLLGVIGIAMSVIRRGTGIGYSIAGSALNGFAILSGVVFMTIFATAVSSVDDTMKKVAAEMKKQQPQAKPANVPESPLMDSNKPSETATNVPATPEVSSPPAIVWHPADQPLQLGDVSVRITEVTIGKVPLERIILSEDSTSEDDLLTIRLQITNTSTTKKLDYLGWMADFSALTGITAKLADENENNYRKITFGGTIKVKGAKSADSIYPGKSIEDAIVFELPIDSAQKLMLTLSGKGIGEDGEFRFEIPRSIIKR